MSSYEESYAGQLRKLVGSRMLLTPGVRGLIRDERVRAFFGSRFMAAGSNPAGPTLRALHHSHINQCHKAMDIVREVIL